VNEIIQGSTEWFAIRCGLVTASKVADVVAKTKSGPSASRATYMGQLIAERLTGTVQESFTNAAMQWGTEREPDARAAYEFRTDATVEQVGFVVHPTITMSGASPDGMVAADGLVEIKCPNTSGHIETLLGRAVPGKYLTQVQWQLASTGRKWCDYVSFDPRLPESMSLFVKRVHRDDRMIQDLETQVIEFIAEMDRKLAELNSAYARKAAA
jgi:putative phage-type endonuclease